jgi:N-acetylated-alpha-linked acidic dipeptidase
VKARGTFVICLAVVAACRDKSSSPSAAAPLDGFDDATAQRARERMFLAVPSSASVAKHVAALAKTPHMAGTPGDAAVASQLATELRGLGFVVSEHDYAVYLPHPKRVGVVVRGDKPLALSLVEDPGTRPIARDAPELLGWNAYAASGSVSAPLVYAGFGRDAEFAALDKAGVDAKGKIVILRYGPLYRGAQIASAERHGAAAVILYVDPKDEPDRPPESFQRGTIVYYWQYTGDPLTPGVPARDAHPRAPADVDVLPKIPVVNISALEAAKLLALLGGPAATGDLDGAFHPRLGPGPIADLTVELDGETRTIRDIVARIPGQTSQEVVLGNHYDAWIFGALDPHSGTAAILEIARGLAKLREAGWKPRRSIVLGLWDAEEFGVIGSTEWVEDHVDELRDAVAYLNIDTIKAGALVVQGEPALHPLVQQCASEVVDPTTGKPFAPTFRPLGIGSDWTAFFHHAGVPSLQWQTGAGKGKYDVWHSVRDDFEYARTKADPELAFIPAYAEVMGLCALRLADADRLPFHHVETATWLDREIDELAKKRPELAADRLHAAVAKLRAAATAADGAVGDRARCDRAVASIDRAFLADDGLVDRPWYRHLATGPDPANGYGALPLPELAAARDAGALDRAIARLIAAIDRATTTLGDCRP